MRRGRLARWLAMVVVVHGVAAASAAGGLVDLARAGEWARLLEVARSRDLQLPLRPEEAAVASHAAVRLGDLEAALRYHGRVTGAAGLAEVGAVELAEALAATRPGEALRLATAPMRGGATEALGDAATDAVVAALDAGLPPDDRRAVHEMLGRVSSPRRRLLELALAPDDSDGGRARLVRLIAVNPRDLVALAAAERLTEAPDLEPRERWHVGAALFHHGRYDAAAELLEPVALRPAPGVPGSEAAFLRGRCDFRRERWTAAVAWFTRAADRAPSSAERAGLELHRARSFELAGDLDGAVEAARRAVRLDAGDDRRLFLARLRLRRGELELARYGLDRVAGQAARDRGRILVALAALRRGERAGAEAELAGVRSPTWAAAAAVVRAGLLAERGEQAAALDAVDRREVWGSPFWAGCARHLISTLSQDLVERWRDSRRSELGSGVVAGTNREATRWAALEISADETAQLAARVSATPEGRPPPATALGGTRLGPVLWNLGLEASAVRWDARGLDDGSPEGAIWLAERCLEHGAPWRSIPLAHEAWKRLGGGLPDRVAPEAVRRTLHPLPWREAVLQASAQGGVAPALLAGVAREESRWQPGALSPVGARGLTQMMPATAARVAASVGLPPPSPAQLFEPELSLRLAAAELGRLLTSFAGLEAAAVAAYNAGEPQARLWLEECGPGCDDPRFAATISFAATRDYVAAVLASRWAYVERGLDPVSE